MIQSCHLSPSTFRAQPSNIPRLFSRHKSITAAIERGKQSSGWNQSPRLRQRSKLPDDGQRTGHALRSKPDRHSPAGYRTRFSSVQQEREEPREHDRQEDGARKPKDPRAPESLPYTTAASEFLYGHSSVLAALKANRRKLYKLYIASRGSNHAGSSAVVDRARALKVNIQEVGDEYERAFDKASSGRPHNGFVLETSPLPAPPITELRSSSVTAGTFELSLDAQSKEDALVNGTQKQYSYKSGGWRHPLVLYVDGVRDEGNLGAITRSAYFLGVDAIITPSRQSAPWSHVTLKASAGAAEGIPIFKVHQPSDFLGRSAREGWQIYASDAIPPSVQRPITDAASDESSSRVVYTFSRSARRLPASHCPVNEHPTILMMGSEDTGLRSSLLNQAHYKVGIRHGREVDEVGVDSLNVSVAASLLCFEMLQKPQPKSHTEELLF